MEDHFSNQKRYCNPLSNGKAKLVRFIKYQKIIKSFDLIQTFLLMKFFLVLMLVELEVVGFLKFTQVPQYKE
jgi:hypothetical protein